MSTPSAAAAAEPAPQAAGGVTLTTPIRQGAAGATGTAPVPQAAAGVTFTVDPWDPGYGMAFGEEMNGDALQESSAELNLDLEIPADQWRPLWPVPAPRLPGAVLFLDGVRRIDARIWVHGSSPQPGPGIAASFAAGLVSCDGAARIREIAVQRGLFTASPDAGGISTRHAHYPAWLAAGAGPDKLSLALQQHLLDAEVQLALLFRAQNPDADDLLVVDGPLRGRTHLDRTVGYIKTHHSSYLPAEQAAVVSALEPGQRTPAFTMGTSWRRSSWYLRLPGSPGVPWSGVVRLECSADRPLPEVVRLANLTALVLPPLASEPHKDPRAPQNLVPIGGLERELRRRLGDQQLLYRSLRAAASTWLS
jgi:hypothetical protein